MGAVWTITRKDLLLRLRDRSILLYGVVAPFVLAVVLGATFGSAEDSIELDLGVVGDDLLTQVLVDEVLSPLQDDGLVRRVERFDEVAPARAAVEDGDLTAVIVLRETPAGALGDAQVIGNVDAPTGVGVTEAIVTAYVDGVAGVSTVVGAGMAAGATDPGPLVAAARDVTDVVAVVREPVGLVPIDLVTYTAAGISIFFLMFSVGIAITGLQEEERDGTMKRLATAPIPSWSPLAAKALTAVLVGVASMALLVVATTVAVGAAWGSPVGVAVLVVAAVLGVTGLVMLVASFTATPEAAGSALGVTGTVLGALGGSFFPLRDTGLLDLLSSLTPHYWFLRGLTRLAGGAAVGEVLGSVAVLLAFGLVTSGMAVTRLRARQGV